MKRQRGGFVVGLIIGLLIGLALALGVALYVTKVPVPFINKVPHRTADQDAAEAERNKNWDPNAGLASKPAARAPVQLPPPLAQTPPPLPQLPTAQPAPPVAAAPPTAPAAPARADSRPGAAGLMFFAQAGAFTRADDAAAQRAKLALLGLDAKISEREQAGRTVYRVRVGPFDARAQADAAIDRLQAAGVESTLVRVERQ
ncbi:MAG TPA: SPOR domain-containing protein [Rubrivivax sp.]|nr:SPOR domain-containing protein [Rubrivivax sp.]